MSVTQTAIPENYRDLLDGPIVASLATLLPDGSPQLTPVWCDYDGRHIRVNTSLSRQKYKDMAARPHVAVLVIDPRNPFRYVEIRGVVAKTTREGAVEHIDHLSKLYTGADRYAFHDPNDPRVLCLIEPVRVRAQG